MIATQPGELLKVSAISEKGFAILSSTNPRMRAVHGSVLRYERYIAHVSMWNTVASSLLL